MYNMFSFTGLVLVFVAAKTVYGQDVQLTLDKECYNEGDSMTLTATYAGSDTYTAVVWYFSGRDSRDVIVLTAGCSVFQSDAGFPLARMTYKCPPDTADSNTYQIILSNLVVSDLGLYDWGATFQVSTSNPDVVKMKPVRCQTPTVEMYDCPGLGNSTAVDSGVKCGCAWFGICCGSLLVVPFLIGIVLGCILICASCCCDCFYSGTGCKDCVSNNYCECKCCASTPCGACCNIGGLPYWYQVLWASIICIPIALGILLVWKCCKRTNEPRRNDSRNKSSGDVPLNTKYSN